MKKNLMMIPVLFLLFSTVLIAGDPLLPRGVGGFELGQEFTGQDTFVKSKYHKNKAEIKYHSSSLFLSIVTDIQDNRIKQIIMMDMGRFGKCKYLKKFLKRLNKKKFKKYKRVISNKMVKRIMLKTYVWEDGKTKIGYISMKRTKKETVTVRISSV